MTDTNDLRTKGMFQKMGRLQREKNRHLANCWKAQKTKMEIMNMYETNQGERLP